MLPVDERAKLPHFYKPLASANLQQLVRTAFTLITLLLFMIPVSVLLLTAVLSPAVRYWTSSALWAVLLVLVVIGGVHIMHWRRGKLSTMWVALGLLLPSLMVGIAAHVTAERTERAANAFHSSDCHFFDAKWDLQLAWDAAYVALSNCYTETMQQHGNLTQGMLQNHFRLVDCTEYPATLAASKHQRNWEYLQQLEQSHLCAGWCYQGPQLWADSVHKDTCAVAVGQQLSEVTGRAVLVRFTMIAILVPSVLLLLLPSGTLDF
mmetsp:Transcript_11506/g.26672  ORF Transcript_11506/g.26672 Transcript_11506/m.26672 type:complete len:264 (-) Transcript_11506:93-884(-)|eukprot:CAMPEP_0178402302 /NCGR_PEP_ID=MMETSP0689_2-20121128/16766_1 /TAXON_ID=160604 /ORGANISM="Amphidinium massartii, Strain CS-259" /LENGTH=263 /DNA_ID=CAMNT_0020023187 /DNA_START=111 /DNA_END=902 /DNA_ORIENTATION=+